MLYCNTKSVPANTTEENPSREIIHVTKGVIKEWWIYAPMEGANLLKLRVFYHGVQVIPFNRPNYVLPVVFRGPILANLKIDTQPYELVVEAWNSDTAIAHEYWVFPNLLREKPVTVTEEEPGLLEALNEYLGVG